MSSFSQLSQKVAGLPRDIQRLSHVRMVSSTEKINKYGKPVLDRAITYDIDLYDALKVGLVSVNSTMRSNLSVGLPLDLLIARRDVCDAELNYRIEPGEPYFHDLRERWSAALRAAHAGIPRPPYRTTR